MTQVIVPCDLAEAQRVLSLRDCCEYCRQYPGHGNVCTERGDKVYAQKRPCKVYSKMDPVEYLAYMEQRAEVIQERRREYNRRYRRRHPERDRASKRRYERRRREVRRVWRRVVELLRVADPELYAELLRAAKDDLVVQVDGGQLNE